MTTVDLSFRLLGTPPVPVDHGYHLYAALSRVLPDVHRESGIGVHPIRGRQIGGRMLLLCPWSTLVIRTDTDRIAGLLPLAGQQLDLAGRTLRVGVPEIHSLRPATTLRSRLVTIKGFLEDNPFREAVRRQLDTLGISEQVLIGLGKRRTLRIKDKEVVGYEVVLQKLTEQESLTVQIAGIGGRRHMGCGVFVPAVKPGEQQ